MPLQNVTILLPCQSLEDFPVDLGREESAEMLAAWSLSWHPELLAATGRMPSWHSATSPPEHMPQTAILLPSASAGEIPAGWLDRIESDSDGAVIVREFNPRPWKVSDAIADFLTVAGARGEVDRALIGDFFALGFCYLMVELQSHQMRYSSNLDTVQLQERVVEAAQSAVAGDHGAARQAVGRAFDSLASARDYYYPVDSYVIDVTLVAPSVFGQPLRDRLAEPTPTNVLLSGQMLEQMASAEPESLAALRNAVDDGTVSIVSGEYCEIDLRLTPPQSWIHEFARAREVFERHLGKVPRIYGRRGLQLVPRLPQVLCNLGFTGLLAATFDGRRLPKSQQSKTRWAGAGNEQIDALWRVPIDAAADERLLCFAHDAGKAMDHDFVATTLFAGWPGATCPGYDDLRRAAGFGLALGQFATLESYFESTAHSDAVMRPTAADGTDVKSILAAGNNPISSRVASREKLAAEETGRRTAVFAGALSHDTSGDPLVANLHGYPRAIYLPTSSDPGDARDPDGLSVGAQTIRDASSSVASPWGEPPDRFVAEVPGLGFARLATAVPPRPPAPLAEGFRLQNEFLQAEIDEITGAIRGIGEYARRGPSVAQQIAFCSSGNGPGGELRGRGEYSVMAADSIRVTTANAACGQIEVNGRLLDRGGETVAGFRQTTRLLRASRLVLFDVELTPHRPSEPSRNESYYALRFAWPTDEASVCDSGIGTREPSGSHWIAASDYIDVRQPAGSWTLFPMGLPVHRRVGEKELDTLLIVDGESCQRFRWAIGLGLASPQLATTAESLFDVTRPACFSALRSVMGESAWLFHVDAANVRLEQVNLLANGRNGVAVGLVETVGLTTKTVLRTFRRATSARRVSLAGEPVDDLPTENGAVPIGLEPYEWIRVEVDWE